MLKMLTGPVKIAVVADSHFDSRDEGAIPTRRCRIADTLLAEAVHHLNQSIRPDLALFLGDVLNDGESSYALDDLQRMRDIWDAVEAPSIAIPGNHDPEADAFYSVFARPAEFVDVAGLRVVPFVDLDEPKWNARRSARDLDRMAEARAGFDGLLVSVQHVPLFPPGSDDCPYNHVNASDVIAAMRRHGFTLSISGHFHRGMGPVRAEGATFLAAPALCEAPFAFLEVVIDGGEVEVAWRQLRE
jgi:3',5'-cyclic AMP phosphodiesterase CpdA